MITNRRPISFRSQCPYMVAMPIYGRKAHLRPFSYSFLTLRKIFYVPYMERSKSWFEKVIKPKASLASLRAFLITEGANVLALILFANQLLRFFVCGVVKVTHLYCTVPYRTRMYCILLYWETCCQGYVFMLTSMVHLHHCLRYLEICVTRVVGVTQFSILCFF